MALSFDTERERERKKWKRKKKTKEMEKRENSMFPRRNFHNFLDRKNVSFGKNEGVELPLRRRDRE